MRYIPLKDEIFHVHTYRCKHASDENDIFYVKKAIELGSKRIVFTDHVPFPENPFRNRMDSEQLQEYIDTINKYKKQFTDEIEILCGLEVEWLPSYENYYRKLREMDGIDLLIIGQHFCEYPDGLFSADSEDRYKDYRSLSKATVEGMKSGLFDVVAHPDRVFRAIKAWGEEEKELAQAMIDAAYEDGKWNGIYFEWNYSSSQNENYLREEFWEMIPDSRMIVKGLDAHSVEEMEKGYLDRKDSEIKFGSIAPF